ncbi:MAG: hypothetical protein OEV76_03790, partial [Anaerolineae bacterium]|nr:hypothetical protein [Anaerolineae bacterium]
AKQKGERELLDLKRDATRLGRELIVALGAPEGVLDTGPIGVATLRQQARERLDAADEVATQDDVDAQLALLRTQLEDTIRKVAIAEEQVERTEGMVTIQNEQLKALRGERTNLDAEEIKAALGPVCPVCSVPVDEALARGCGLSNVFQHPAKIANDKARTDQQIKECESAIEQLQKKQSKLQTDCEALKGKEADLRQEIKGLERAAAKARRDQRQQWFAARRLVEDVDRLETLSHDRGEAQQKLDQTGETEEHLKATLKEHRQQHRDILQRVEELFDYVCKGILGSETESSLSLTGKGLQADLRVGGEAMNSLKTVAFDLATLLMSIEGRSGLPSFLIHDSPREADLGLSHYHQYFRLMSELERVAGEPPFQYIVTTTTDPPEYHQTQPYLVAQLSGSDQEGRLLRRSLDVVPHGNTD